MATWALSQLLLVTSHPMLQEHLGVAQPRVTQPEAWLVTLLLLLLPALLLVSLGCHQQQKQRRMHSATWPLLKLLGCLLLLEMRQQGFQQ